MKGIRGDCSDDVQAAKIGFFVIKHVAAAELNGDAVSLVLRPSVTALVASAGGIRDENNAVLVRGDAVGEMLFSGKGAGSLPSASLVHLM